MVQIYYKETMCNIFCKQVLRSEVDELTKLTIIWKHTLRIK